MNSKRSKLLDAIKNKDKVKLKEALQLAKPVKWLTYTTHDNGKLEYGKTEVTKEELEAIIKEEEKENQVNLIQICITKHKFGTREETFHFEEGA